MTGEEKARRSAGQNGPEIRSGASGNRVKIGVLTVLLAVLSAAHFLSPVHDIWIHDFLFKVTYLPIVLAGLWFGRRGGLSVALLTAVIYTFHIRWQLAGHHQHEETGFWLELVLYLVIGVTVGVLSDAQHRAEARLRRANRDLGASLASLREKTEALLVAETSLHRADRLKAVGELAASVAHEVRNPLGGILGAAKILADPSSGQDVRTEFSSVLTKEIKHLDDVISRLLDLSRPAAGKPGESVLAQEIALVEKLTAGAREEKAVSFDTAGVDPQIRVAIASDALRQVVLNLAFNALAAAPPSGGRVEWETTVAGGNVVLRVKDNGSGVDPSIRDSIFEPFVSSGRGEHSTGLGLPIVARLLADVGGGIELTDTGPAGTTFRIELPIAGERSAPPNPDGGSA